MKIKAPFFPLFVSLLALTSRALAQAPDTNGPITNAPAVQVEDLNPGSNQPSAFANDDFEWRRVGVEHEALVVLGHDVDLKSNDTARTVVVIGGNARIHGRVSDGVVVIGGDIEVDGKIRHAIVSILGNIHAGKGAVLDGKVAVIGGRIDAADDVKFLRPPVELDLGGLGTALRQWIFQCVFKLRPLAPQVGFVWVVAAAFFLVYLMVALILPGPVRACAAELTRRPATTFFMGLLMKIVAPLVLGILIATGVGALVVPFALAALIFGAIVGKVALFEFLGASVGRRFGADFLQNPLIAFLIGIFLITLFYMVPVLGLITLGVVSVWGLGGAVTAAFSGWKRELPKEPAAPVMPSQPLAEPMGAGSTAFAPGSSGPSNPPGTMGAVATAPPYPPANVPEAYAYPRAGFWERMGAGFLDCILLGFITALFHGSPLALLVGLVYFAGMWAWKGTTIGGVVLGLKVVRQDGYPVTLLVSVVRGLAAAFSIAVFFLGFLWIVFDREKQGWHDKIAGTVVIKMPKGTPLVMF